jgi:hypothetical protein
VAVRAGLRLTRGCRERGLCCSGCRHRNASVCSRLRGQRCARTGCCSSSFTQAWIASMRGVATPVGRPSAETAPARASISVGLPAWMPAAWRSCARRRPRLPSAVAPWSLETNAEPFTDLLSSRHRGRREVTRRWIATDGGHRGSG